MLVLMLAMSSDGANLPMGLIIQFSEIDQSCVVEV